MSSFKYNAVMGYSEKVVYYNIFPLDVFLFSLCLEHYSRKQHTHGARIFGWMGAVMWTTIDFTLLQ